MIIFIAIFVIATSFILYLFWKDWKWLEFLDCLVAICAGFVAAFIVTFLVSIITLNAIDTEKYECVDTKNVAIVQILDKKSAIAKVSSNGTLYYTVMTAEDYNTVDCSAEHFSFQTSTWSDSYVTISTYKLPSPWRHLIFSLGSTYDSYVLHAPANTICLDTLY